MLAKKLLGAAAAAEPVYIEDVFSTYLYTGNGSTQTITNGIDLAGEGGLVWTKSRSVAKHHGMWDTVRGAGTGSGSPFNRTISSSGLNLSAFYSTDYLSSFNSTGFAVTYGDATYSVANQNSTTYTSWSFRKQPKFFDIQTWTGSGVAGKTITHDLGSVPGCIMVLCTTANYSWFVYHRSANAGGNTTSLQLNSTAAAVNEGNAGIQNLTSTTFQLGGSGANSTRLNDSGQTYIAYLFAHDAGGFGDDGNQNVISCGSFTTDSGGNFSEVNLGYEPQWLLIKNATTALGFTDWRIVDNMRGFTTSTDTYLAPNTTAAEGTAGIAKPTATGFAQDPSSNIRENTTYIYIAIRRGPMKTPEAGTEVFAEDYLGQSSGGIAPAHRSGWPVDAFLRLYTPGGSNDYPGMFTRLLGKTFLVTSKTLAEQTFNNDMWPYNNGVWNATSPNSSIYTAMLRRAPGFFDVVCYTGTNTLRTVNHNLGAPPELVIIKIRNSVDNWGVWTSYTSMSSWYRLNENTFSFTPNYFDSVSPTSTEFTLKASGVFAVNQSGYNYVAYLFASCPGVSKVGSYTGTGTTQQINCGFSSGARFVLIKRTDSTGDWYVWDSARGIVSGNDPYLLLNSTAAEVTNTDYIDPYSAGFEISSTAPAEINANGGTFIFLAIA